MMRILTVALVTAVAGHAGAQTADVRACGGSQLSNRIVGTWRLLTFVRHDADGRESSPFGPKPLGALMYDHKGHMSVQIARAHQRPFPSDDASRAGVQELRDALESYFAYFGSYTVDERTGTVTHHVERGSHANFDGKDQKRMFTLQGDRLVLTTARESTDAPGITYVATWERRCE